MSFTHPVPRHFILRQVNAPIGEVDVDVLPEVDELQRGAHGVRAGEVAVRRSFEKVQQKAPLTIRYRGRAIAAPPPPAGGIFICQILRMLERFDLTAFEHNSADYIAIVAEAMWKVPLLRLAALRGRL